MQQPQNQFRTLTSSPLSLPVFQQETQPLSVLAPEITPIPDPLVEDTPAPLVPLKFVSKKRLTRIVASALTLLLAGAIVVIWFVAPPTSSSSPPAGISQQSFGSSNQN